MWRRRWWKLTEEVAGPANGEHLGAVNFQTLQQQSTPFHELSSCKVSHREKLVDSNISKNLSCNRTRCH